LETPFPFLVVGLGNPGEEYASSPHNIGFEVVDELARRWKISSFQKKYQALFADTTLTEGRVLLLKPQTYMNLSGQSVQKALSFFKLDPSIQMLVISDDMDLPLGQLRMRLLGGTGGHNGLKSITECIGTEKYPRIRIGVGRGNARSDIDFLLSKIPKSDRKVVEEAITRVADGIEQIIKTGLEKSMNFVNQKRNNEP